MSESMVERVRHAISSTEGCNEDGRPCVKCDDLTFPGCAVLARAAIAAMREPTERMRIAGQMAIPSIAAIELLRRTRDKDGMEIIQAQAWSFFCDAWIAAIDEALKPD